MPWTDRQRVRRGNAQGQPRRSRGSAPRARLRLRPTPVSKGGAALRPCAIWCRPAGSCLSAGRPCECSSSSLHRAPQTA
eukprot:2113268-Alexandrium_andersonii.AAC.1